MIEMVGEDSGKSEGRAARVGDGRVEREIGKRRRYWPGGGRGGGPLAVGRNRIARSGQV
jgi:hypothetical protein